MLKVLLNLQQAVCVIEEMICCYLSVDVFLCLLSVLLLQRRSLITLMQLNSEVVTVCSLPVVCLR